MAKTCPLCRTGMSSFNLDSIVLDRCETCEGVWYDAKELRAYGKKMGLGRLARRLTRSSTEPIEGLQCSNCADAMLARADRNQLTMYGCGTCRGWFVSGPEMSKLRRRHMEHVLADGVAVVDSDRSEIGMVSALRGFFSR